MTLEVGFDAQVPSLPDAGSVSSSLGETFSPDLSTGTADFSIRIDTPNGPNDIGPRLALRYDSSSGNGLFGLGFGIRLPRIQRSIAHGYPRYDLTDTLILEGAGELLVLADGTLKPIVDAGAWRIGIQGDGFQLIDRGGSIYTLGTMPSARLFDAVSNPAGVADATFAWHLERIDDALGNAAIFNWERDGNQLYLVSVVYGPYQIIFKYGSRPDTLRWGRAGFLVTTSRRCEAIELTMPREAQPVLRRWRLGYVQHELNGGSLLSSVTLSGIDGAGNSLDAPAVSLGYSVAAARTLTRMRSVDNISPGALQRAGSRAELIDWFGTGLPDLLEISGGGRARVWPNLGGLTWGRPQTVGTLPLFSSPDAAVTFIDMNGDGMADIVRADRPISTYVPRTRDGFERPVLWPRAPAVPPTDPNARLADADGDGMADLYVADGNTLAIYYRHDPEGWASVPQVVAMSGLPAAELGDPHVFLADMTGSGSLDLVRVDGGGVTYWPALGRGRWADAVRMANPPSLPFDLVPRRIFLQDIDGDGCADLVYLDKGRASYWINQVGCGFSDMGSIAFLPIAEVAELRWADMSGSGANGLLWSANIAGRTAYFFLDFVGGAKSYLLESIDNGSGLVTAVEYSTSAREAARDRSAGVQWSSSMPIVVPVVSAITRRDQATGNMGRTEYRYHEGRYDGVLREFAGFGQVECSEIGDITAPTLLQTTRFHNGLADDGSEPRTRAERMMLRAIRGRLYQQDRTSPDGTQRQNLPFDRLEQNWIAVPVETPAGTVHRPTLVQSTRTIFEQTNDPVGRHTTTNTAWDDDGNITDTTETVEALGRGDPPNILRTHCDFAVDPARRFISLAWRTRQFDSSDNVIADLVTEYDHAPEGRVGTQGLVTRRSALVLTDELIADVYGGAPPDLATLGYFQRNDEPGWWITQAAYTRVDDGAGLRGTTTDANGAVTTYSFNGDRTFPVAVTDPMGNVTTAVYDDRCARPALITDAGGTAGIANYDGLARLTSEINAGDSIDLPTLAFEYASGTAPVAVIRHQRAESGLPTTIDTRDIFEGAGRLIERRERDAIGEIAVTSRRYSPRGFVARAWRPFRRPSTVYEDPGEMLPHTAFFYDALGRSVRTINPDGSFRTAAYSPLLIEEADEEDTNTDIGATHRNTPTRKHLDASGRVISIEQNIGGRLIATHYEYDLKDNLVRHVDESGNEMRFWFDLLGRQLRVRRPERDACVVRDPVGRPVETRVTGTEPVFREYDALGRLVALRVGSKEATAIHTFTYHDAGRPAPPDAGAHTSGGRLVRVDDEAGSTVFDYDARGRQTHRSWRMAGDDRAYEIDTEFRADGRVATINYPEGQSGRRRVEHVYDVRGRLVEVTTVVPEIEYDISGLITRMRYANGTEIVVSYDDVMGRTLSRVLTAPTQWQCATTYTWDKVGNLLTIGSEEQKLAAAYTYDDLYRLTKADTPLGEHYEYRYADNGVIAFKSDVGEYRYGEGGAAPTCLTTAGSLSLTYGPTGEITSAPWGEQEFDPLGRLRRISRDGVTLVQNVYDWKGRRVASTTSAQGTSASRLTPDALYSIETGDLVLNLFAGDQMAARQLATGEVSFLHFDHLGSVIAVSDGGGGLIDTLRYDPFGRLLERNGNIVAQPIGFTGGEYDTTVGLLYLQARYYHPGLGVFVSVDPIVHDPMIPIAWAAYAYCGNNPTTLVDPSGMSFNLGKFVLGLTALVALTAAVLVSAGAFTPVAASAAIAGEEAFGVIAAEQAFVSTYTIFGAVTGGLIGGLTVAREEGKNADFWDIVLATTIGAAVGGWASYATVYGEVEPGKLVGEGLGKAVFGADQDVLSGALNNAVSQSGLGFAHAIARPIAGTGGVDANFWKDVVQSAISGYVSGSVQSVVLGPSIPQHLLPFQVAKAEIVPGAAVVSAEQVATSQIEWHHKFFIGTSENSSIGTALDVAAGFAGIKMNFG
jgi:RHS repeat-associated protein